MHQFKREKLDISHFMPLSNGARPRDGPSKSVFSVPAFDYSPETRALVKDLMTESRLTFTQKSGFQSILRKGKPLPVRPTDIFRQQLYKHKHAEKARCMGMSVMNPNHNPFISRRSHFMRYSNGGRRTYNTIQATGELDPPVIHTRRYIPRDKEQEKIRLAYRMEFGKDPPPKDPQKASGKLGPLIQGFSDMKIAPKSNVSLLDERFEELVKEIQERIEFLDSMKILGNERSYRGPISAQIQELVAQMKSISKEKTTDLVKILQLEKIDKCFSENGYEFDSLFTDKDKKYNTN